MASSKKKKKIPKQSFEDWSRQQHGVADDEQSIARRKEWDNVYKSYNADEDDDIAPVKTTVKSEDVAPTKEQGKGWFQKGALEDGFSWKNLGKTIGGSITDLGENIGAGFVEAGERLWEGALALGTSMNQTKMNEAAQNEIVFNAVTGKKEKAENTLKRYQNYQDEVEEASAKTIAKDSWDGQAIAKKIVDPAERLVGIDTEGADSVFAEKSDSLAQSAGQLLASQTANLIAPGSGLATMGIMTYGGEMENALKNGATWDEASLSATISSVAEMGTELLFGGIDFGHGTLDDLITDKIAKNITSKTARHLLNFAGQTVGEGFEEILAGAVTAVGQKMSYMEEKELKELFSSEDLLDSFIGGAVLGGIGSAGKAVKGEIKGIDSVTGLTKNEQKVVDKVVKDRIAEAEKDGKKLTAKEKANIHKDVMTELEKGGISTDTIEEVLGGEDYKRYKAEVERQEAIKKELDELQNTPSGQLSYNQNERMKELQAFTPNTEMTDTLKFSIDENIRKEITADGDRLKNLPKDKQRGSYLTESYNEKANRGKAFEANLSQYDTKQQETIKKAVESGILNNTRRTHEFVDFVSKISADKGVPFDFTNNAKIKETGFAIDGKTVNGYVTKDGIALNIDSAKALNSTVGHEITHILEGTDLYTELQSALFEYAKAKNDYQGRYDTLTELYKDVEGADIDAELTADLVGDYLFTDSDFVNRLSTEHRNIFQKIYDEIKYLCKVVTAGSKEARQLEKVKKAFEEAYRKGGKAQTDTKYSLSDSDGKQLSKGQQEYFKDSKVRDENGKLLPVYHGSKKSGFNVFEYSKDNQTGTDYGEAFYFTSDLQKARGYSYDVTKDPRVAQYREEKDALRKKYLDTFSEEDKNAYLNYKLDGKSLFDLMGDEEYLTEGGEVKKVYLDLKNPLIVDAGGKYYYEVYQDYFDKARANGNDGIIVKNVIDNPRGEARPIDTYIAFRKEQIKNIDNLNPTSNTDIRYSLSDSDGKKLTKEQSEYFKDSKMRDENGNLKVMYHGSQDAGFHEFNSKFSDDDTSFFFVDRNDVAASYSGTSETYEAQTIHTAEDMNKFIESIDAEGYEVVEKDGKFILLYEGDRVAASDTAKGIYEEFCWYEGVGEGDANYKVYLNLTNPLVVDAEGRNWNNVSRDFSEEIYDKYKSLNEAEKSALTDLAGWEDIGVFRDAFNKALVDLESGFYSDDYTKNLASAFNKLGGYDANVYDIFTIASENFSEESLKQFAVKQMNTRDYAKKAKAEGYDGVIFNNIVDLGGYSNGSEGASTVAIAFDSNQIKSVANEKPTSDPDIRYSLSEDSEGRELSPAVQNRFAKSRVVDENGKLKAVYHGTYQGEFSIFDKAKGSVEGDFGSGFYFTDNETDVSEHYEGGGPDFENKVGRRADEIQNENPDLSYEEAEERAHKELYKGGHKFKVYLNIENPAIVGETNLLEQDSYFSEYNQEDYDNEDDYYADVEQLVADDIDGIIWEIQRNVDVDNTDGIAEVLWNAFNDGGVGIEDLKKQLNNLYLEDSEGNLVANEVARQIIESLGYDGIIDPTVSGKWNMDMEEGTTHYIVFKPNQIKSVTNENPTDNPDIHKSLSAEGESFKKYGNFNIYGKDIRYKGTADIAPTQGDLQSPTEEVAPIYTEPISEPSVADLDAQRLELESKIAEALQTDDMETFERLSYEHQALTERIAQAQEEDAAFESERLASLDDADAPIEQEAPFYDEMPDTTPLTDKAVTEIVKPVKEMLGLSNKQTAAVKAAVEKYSTAEYASREELHEVIKDSIGNIFEEEVPGVREVQNYLRKTKIKPSDAIKNDIADYNQVRLSHFGKIRVSNEGIDVDSAYQELASLYPEFFPDDIVNPSDQFMRMVEVADMSKTIETEYEVDNEVIEEAADIIIEGINGYKQNNLQKLAEAEAKHIPKVAPGEDIAPVPEAYEAIRPQKPKTEKYRLKRATPEEQARAEILTEEPKTEKKKRGFWLQFMEKFADKGFVFENLAKKTKNRELEAKWNFIRYAEGNAQTFMKEGADGVNSLKSIVDRVEKSGKTKQFYEYLYHQHNIDRMTLAERDLGENKTVFGYSVTADSSRGIVAQLEKANPEFKAMAQEIYTYNKHLRKMLVDGNVISQETADLWEKMYPHYVPIRRAGDSGLNINVPLDTGKTGVNAPIKRATGGSRDILPLFDTMAQRTLQTYKAVARNRFGVELKNALGSTVESEAATLDGVIDSIDSQDSLLQEGKNGKNPTFTVFENGEKVTFEITDDMYDALKPKNDMLAYRNKFLGGLSNLQRGLLTEYSPVFMLTNAVKDVQDVLINSQHAARTYANMPKAVAEMMTKGKWYTEYMRNGGEQNSYFDNDSNTFKEERAGIKKLVGMPLDIISSANNIIERLPRLAEYIASRKSGRSVEVSMLDAARVTTNFAAGGDVTKFLNANGCTFLNASVQGAMQQVRNVREAKMNGLKGWVSLAAKCAIAGLAADALNHLLWDDDEEYEELSDYVKQNYYVIAKTEDGKFIRIPKGRALAVIQDAMEQVKNAATGDDEVDLKSFLELVVSNLAPNNPIDNNILAPIIQVANNETWYGEDLVPTRLQDLPEAEQFDESTDAISKWLGENLNYSPYKINYLLNQYSGGVGDVVMPMLTPEAESGDNSPAGNMIAPLKDKFTTDGVMNNQNISDFYDKVDELTALAKSSEATDEDVLRYKYINSVNSELGELYGQKREIQNSELSDAAKYSAVRAIQEQIVSIAREGLYNYETVSIDGKYAIVGDRQYRLNEEGEWTKISDRQLERQNEVTEELGISPAEYWEKTDISFMPRTDGEYEFAYESPGKYGVAKVIGDYDEYKSYTSELYGITADKDSDGKTISGSAKEKKTDYIFSLPLDYGQKIILYRSLFDAKKDKDKYNADIVEYLDSRDDISWEEMKTILEELDMTVYDDGRITW